MLPAYSTTFDGMNLLLEPLLTAAYAGLCVHLISRWRFFRVGSIPVRWFQGVFLAKVLSGIVLTLVYTYYYTDRTTADIWKYFDDGLVMFSALSENPLDYLRMLFGILNDTPHFDRYYSEMGHWYRPYGSQMANDTHTIIRFNAAVRLVSFGCYQVHAVWANFLGLIGLTGILAFIRPLAAQRERWLFAGVFLMPWVMFWGSGVLKEPLLLFGLGMLLYGSKSWSDRGLSLRNGLLMAVSMLFLLTVKSYALVAIVPGLVALYLSGRLPRLHPGVLFLIVYLFTGAFAVMIGRALPDQDVLQRLAQKQHDFNRLATGGTYLRQIDLPNDTLFIPAMHHSELEFSADRKAVSLKANMSARRWKEAYSEVAAAIPVPSGARFEVLLDYGRTGSAIDIPKLDGTVNSTLRAIPMALVNALFRPFPADVTSPLMLIGVAENLLVVLLVLLAFHRMETPILSAPLFWFCLSFAVVILVLTGLVTPVVGAIVRYKVPALPFLICALLVLIRPFSREREAVKP